MAWLDIDELAEIHGRGRLLPSSRWAPLSFQVEDHLDSEDRDLRSSIHEKVRELGGENPTGPIRLLTQLRSFGYYFSPLNLYYLYDESDREIRQVLAEVNNTPWGDRHFYLLDGRSRTHPSMLRYAHAKEFHVSPFMGMGGQYQWRLNAPGETLTVGVANCDEQHGRFDACMSLKRRPLTRGALARLSIRRPLATVQLVAAIYYQALLLWWNRCPFHPHPQTH